MAAAADLLAVDTKVVERLSAPAENELQNVPWLLDRICSWLLTLSYDRVFSVPDFGGQRW
jgi:hypothetical protein